MLALGTPFLIGAILRHSIARKGAKFLSLPYLKTSFTQSTNLLLGGPIEHPEKTASMRSNTRPSVQHILLNNFACINVVFIIIIILIIIIIIIIIIRPSVQQAYAITTMSTTSL